MKQLLSLRASGRLSTAGAQIAPLLLSTLNGQRPGNFPTPSLSLRKGKSLAEIDAVGTTKQEPSLGMMI